MVPDGIPFEAVNQIMNKRAISDLIDICYRQVGLKETVVFADQLMYTGFSYATKAGLSIGWRTWRSRRTSGTSSSRPTLT